MCVCVCVLMCVCVYVLVCACVSVCGVCVCVLVRVCVCVLMCVCVCVLMCVCMCIWMQLHMTPLVSILLFSYKSQEQTVKASSEITQGRNPSLFLCHIALWQGSMHSLSNTTQDLALYCEPAFSLTHHKATFTLYICPHHTPQEPYKCTNDVHIHTCSFINIIRMWVINGILELQKLTMCTQGRWSNGNSRGTERAPLVLATLLKILKITSHRWAGESTHYSCTNAQHDYRKYSTCPEQANIISMTW